MTLQHVLAALATVALLGPAGALADAGQDRLFGSSERFQEQGGEMIYRYVCAGCHMRDGKGAAGAGSYPALAGNNHLEESGYPIAIVLHGHKAMPPLGEFLTDQQVANVVNFVRQNLGKYTDAVTAADVKAER